MQLLKEAMETIKGDNQKLRRALQASEIEPPPSRSSWQVE